MTTPSSAYLSWQTSPGAAPTMLYFDVVLSESPNLPATITEHVVEVGADVTDNIRVGLKKLALEVFVSNEPISADSQWSAGFTGSVGPITTPDPQQPAYNPLGPVLDVPLWFTLPLGVPLVGSLLAHELDVPTKFAAGVQPTLGTTINPQVLTFSSEFDAVAGTHDLLDTLRTAGQLFTVYGSKAVYENMAIEDFSMTRTPDEGNGGSFTINLKEIRFVSTSVVKAPMPSTPRGAGSVSHGAQSTIPEPTAGASVQSVAHLLAGWFSGTTPAPLSNTP